MKKARKVYEPNFLPLRTQPLSTFTVDQSENLVHEGAFRMRHSRGPGRSVHHCFLSAEPHIHHLLPHLGRVAFEDELEGIGVAAS